MVRGIFILAFLLIHKFAISYMYQYNTNIINYIKLHAQSGRSSVFGNKHKSNKVKETKSSIITNSDVKDKNEKKVKSYAQQTIWGQNIINCRQFSIDDIQSIDFIGSYHDTFPVYPHPEVAFLGRSNVGKSSLLNCLTNFKKKVAIVSKIPGCTQAMNLYQCKDQRGPVCMFVDLPGYGYAKLSKSSISEINTFIVNYIRSRSSLRVAVLLVDARRSPQQLDIDMAQTLHSIGLPYILVATKCDLLSDKELLQSINSINNHFSQYAPCIIAPENINNAKNSNSLSTEGELLQNQAIMFSSKSGIGRRQLWQSIRSGILGEYDLMDSVEDDLDSFVVGGDISESYSAPSHLQSSTSSVVEDHPHIAVEEKDNEDLDLGDEIYDSIENKLNKKVY